MNIKNLSIDEKIGQMLCLAFHGTTYNQQLKFLIEDNHLGNIIHFARNITSKVQITKLNDEIREHAKNPMFISLDQEGGMVRRVVDEMTYMPGAMALTAAGLSSVYEINYRAGLDLKAMGFNVNYAPVADVNNNPLNPVINSRSYSDDAKIVSQAVSLAFKGMQDAGVLPTVKHFPGHGDTNVDSHLGLPIVSKTINEMMDLELLPFIDAIKNGLDGVMVSHILYDKIDQDLPSSLSKKVISDLLIDQLGFKGLVTTDSLTMKAIWGKYTIEDIVLNSINAGNDVIVFCGGAQTQEQQKIINAFKKLVKEGKISIERIDESVKKIIKLKSKYNSLENSKAKYDNTLSLEVVSKSITKVKDTGLLPITETNKTLILFPKITLASLVDNEDSTYETLGKYLKAEEVIIEEGLTDINDLLEKTAKYDRIVLCTYNLKASDIQVEIFNSLDKTKTIVIALRSPYDILELDGVLSYICTYDITKESLKALSSKLQEGNFLGKLPVKL